LEEGFFPKIVEWEVGGGQMVLGLFQVDDDDDGDDDQE
jgi:hypothetical protein